MASAELQEQPLAGYMGGSFLLHTNTQGAVVTRPPGCSLLSLGDIYLRDHRGALDKKTALPSMRVVFVQHWECVWHERCWDRTGGPRKAENCN